MSAVDLGGADSAAPSRRMIQAHEVGGSREKQSPARAGGAAGPGEQSARGRARGGAGEAYQPTELRWPCLVISSSPSQTARPFLVVVRLSWKV